MRFVMATSRMKPIHGHIAHIVSNPNKSNIVNNRKRATATMFTKASAISSVPSRFMLFVSTEAAISTDFSSMLFKM